MNFGRGKIWSANESLQDKHSKADDKLKSYINIQKYFPELGFLKQEIYMRVKMFAILRISLTIIHH